MRRFLIVVCLTVLACDSPGPEGRGTVREPIRDTMPAESQVAWDVRPIVNAPRYFVLSGWVTNDTLWGLAGSNPIDIHVPSGAGRPWSARGASGASRSPDGTALGWADTAGIWIMRRGGSPRRVLSFASLSERPAGDPPNSVMWAPNGRRLLTWWSEEWTRTYGLVDTASGSIEILTTRLPGYMLPGAELWLDDRRILFTTRATGPKGGEPEYRESGWRGDLAVLDLGTHQYERVTDVVDDVGLGVMAAWGDTVLALRRTSDEPLATFVLFDTRTWRETPSGLPRGTTIAASRDGSLVAVFRSDNLLSQVLIRARQPGMPSAAPVLIPGRITSAAWSPNGRRLALSTVAEEQIEGAPGDLRTVYRLSVIEAP